METQKEERLGAGEEKSSSNASRRGCHALTSLRDICARPRLAVDMMGHIYEVMVMDWICMEEDDIQVTIGTALDNVETQSHLHNPPFAIMIL